MAGPNKSLITVDVAFAFMVAGVLAVLLLPLPTMVMDLLQVLNLTASLLLLLIMFHLRTPLDFSSFPALLLVLTLYRLSLNVACTKLILINGFAGNVIDSFGKLVVGNNYVVGAVMFLIIVIINFMVITKGAGRIAEVSARFTLDAMPGKQMSIDADLNAGLIDENEARARRHRLSAEAEFYGSMDGASKFVKGEAMAGLVITAINILGGLAIGMFQRQMPLEDALRTYTLLTIGDGLVTQIPALMGSVAAGILVTKAADSEGLGQHIYSQLFRRPEPFFITGAILGGMALVPSMPHLAFLTLAGGCLAAGSFLVRKQKEAALAALIPTPAAAGGAPAKKEGPGGKGTEKGGADASPTAVSLITLDIGFGLVPLADPQLGGDLVERLTMVRKQIRDELGFLIPSVSVQDNLELANNGYRVMMRGIERARGTVQVGSHLAINPGDVSGEMEGLRATDPAFGLPAVWINSRRVDVAEAKGYTVVDCSSVVATHLTKIIRENAAELLTRQAVSDVLDKLKATEPTVVAELVPQQLSVGGVHRVLQLLLAEQIPIHDLAAILETLADYAGQNKDPLVLSELCRQALRGHILSGHLSDSGTLYAFVLAPAMEDELQQAVSRGRSGAMNLTPERAEMIVQRLQTAFENLRQHTETAPVLLVTPAIRPHLFRLVHRKVADLAVLSYAEIMDEVNLRIVGNVDTKDSNGALAA